VRMNNIQHVISYNLAIKRHKPDFYDKADMIRLNTPWYTVPELETILTTVTKPKFVDVNIKKRIKDKTSVHDYKKLLSLLGEHDVQWVGISNVEDTATYYSVRKLLNNNITKICAKIETGQGCINIKKIIDVYDGIMVDNEDLASDIGWKHAAEQKDKIYKLCEVSNKVHFRLSGVIFSKVSSNKVVYTYGAFDLLHPGHIKMLETAKSYGNKLIVGIVGDSAISELKGKNRPIQTLKDRIKIISSLKCVDEVIEQTEYNPIENLEKYRPDILVKGDDWKHIPGEKWMRENGGILIKPSYSKDWSTSKVVKKMMK